MISHCREDSLGKFNFQPAVWSTLCQNVTFCVHHMHRTGFETLTRTRDQYRSHSISESTEWFKSVMQYHHHSGMKLTLKICCEVVWCYEGQLWSGNHFQSILDLEHYLLTLKSIGHILDTLGASFMIIGWLLVQPLMVCKSFSITNAPQFWHLDPKINRAYSWLAGSKCMKFHVHRWIT